MVSRSRKYDRGLTQLLHVELHWLDVLDVPERIKYKLSMMMRRRLNGTAPHYLAATVFQSLQLLQGNTFVLLPVISW